MLSFRGRFWPPRSGSTPAPRLRRSLRGSRGLAEALPGTRAVRDRRSPRACFQVPRPEASALQRRFAPGKAYQTSGSPSLACRCRFFVVTPESAPRPWRAVGAAVVLEAPWRRPAGRATGLSFGRIDLRGFSPHRCCPAGLLRRAAADGGRIGARIEGPRTFRRLRVFDESQTRLSGPPTGVTVIAAISALRRRLTATARAAASDGRRTRASRLLPGWFDAPCPWAARANAPWRPATSSRNPTQSWPSPLPPTAASPRRSWRATGDVHRPPCPNDVAAHRIAGCGLC